MPAVARQGDTVNTGHLCDGITTIAEGSPNVRVNGLPVAYQGAALAPHTIKSGDNCVPHPGQIVNIGSTRVRVNGKGIARVGDSADLGNISKGSTNVFAN